VGLARAHENRPVPLCVTGEIFSPRFLFDGPTVCAKYLHLVLGLTLEIVVQGCPAYFAAHPGS
jgi:hypothetical protein